MKKYRVGRKQGRAVLDETGRTVIVLDSQEEAQEYCAWKNRLSSPLKPLSELHKDEEACRRVRDLITGPSASIEYWEGRTSFGGSADDAEIHDNGEFTDEVFGRKVNIFALVDLIRELGYEPEN